MASVVAALAAGGATTRATAQTTSTPPPVPARVASAAGPGTNTTILVSTTIPARPTTPATSGLKLTVRRFLAAGALRFEPADPTTKVIRSRTTVVRTAKRELASGTVAPTPEVFFGRYSMETTERVTGGAAKVKRELRHVWVVRFAGVEGRRQTTVIIRQNLPTQVPVTTIDRAVLSDIVVVIDDATGNVLLRSEFAPETVAATVSEPNR